MAILEKTLKQLLQLHLQLFIFEGNKGETLQYITGNEVSL